jgi:hypothetical protein
MEHIYYYPVRFFPTHVPGGDRGEKMRCMPVLEMDVLCRSILA